MWQKYLLHPKYCTKKKINSLQAQRLKRLIRWFQFVWYVTFYMFHSAADFLYIYYGDGRHNIVFLIGKIQLRIPIERVVFSDCSRIWNPQSWPQKQSKYYATLPANQIFLLPRFHGNVTSRNQCKREAVDREPGNEVERLTHWLDFDRATRKHKCSVIGTIILLCEIGGKISHYSIIDRHLICRSFEWSVTKLVQLIERK